MKNHRGIFLLFHGFSGHFSFTSHPNVLICFLECKMVNFCFFNELSHIDIIIYNFLPKPVMPIGIFNHSNIVFHSKCTQMLFAERLTFLENFKNPPGIFLLLRWIFGHFFFTSHPNVLICFLDCKTVDFCFFNELTHIDIIIYNFLPKPVIPIGIFNHSTIVFHSKPAQMLFAERLTFLEILKNPSGIFLLLHWFSDHFFFTFNPNVLICFLDCKMVDFCFLINLCILI